LSPRRCAPPASWPEATAAKGFLVAVADTLIPSLRGSPLDALVSPSRVLSCESTTAPVALSEAASAPALSRQVVDFHIAISPDYAMAASSSLGVSPPSGSSMCSMDSMLKYRRSMTCHSSFCSWSYRMSESRWERSRRRWCASLSPCEDARAGWWNAAPADVREDSGIAPVAQVVIGGVEVRAFS
jgi:hypothetical protein